MSLPEISKSMGDLAAAITKKNKELDRLKNEYEDKLRLLEKYLAHIPSTGIEKQDMPEFLSSIEGLDSPVTCPHCNTSLFDLNNDSDFILVPKNRLQPMARNTLVDERSFPNDSAIVREKSAYESSARVSYNTTRETRNKSKRTCSYCAEPGHSRARCFTRLSREPPTQNSGSS